MSTDPGVPYGSGPGEAAADAEPVSANEYPSASTTGPAGSPPASPPLAIPGIPLDRPELHVGAAFAAGFVLALVLKRLAR